MKKIKTESVVTIIFVLVIFITTLTGCSGKIDPTAFLSVPEFSGCDGYGTAVVAFDEKALIEQAIGEEPAPMTEAFWEWADLYDEYSRNISCKYTHDGLSNGDSFVVTIAVTGAAAEKIDSVELQYTVEGLSAVKYLDVFKDVEVQFSGISGNAMAKLSLNGNNDVLNSCKFNIEPSYGLQNGDVVTVTITNTDNLLNKFCTLPETASMSYTVSGLEYYATADDLPMDVVQQIGQQLVSEQQQENDDDPNFIYSSVELYGIFFMTGKEDAWADENQLHFVLHYNMLEDDGDVRNAYYIPLYIKDILVTADGNIVLQREDCVSLFFYDTAESYLEKYEDDYDITQIG